MANETVVLSLETYHKLQECQEAVIKGGFFLNLYSKYMERTHEVKHNLVSITKDEAIEILQNELTKLRESETSLSKRFHDTRDYYINLQRSYAHLNDEYNSCLKKLEALQKQVESNKKSFWKRLFN